MGVKDIFHKKNEVKYIADGKHMWTTGTKKHVARSRMAFIWVMQNLWHKSNNYTNRMHNLINKQVMIIQTVLSLCSYFMMGSQAHSVGQKLKSLGNTRMDVIHVLYWQHMRNTLLLWNVLLSHFVSQPLSFTLTSLIFYFYVIFGCHKEQQMTEMKPHLVRYVVGGEKKKTTFWTSTG